MAEIKEIVSPLIEQADLESEKGALAYVLGDFEIYWGELYARTLKQLQQRYDELNKPDNTGQDKGGTA